MKAQVGAAKERTARVPPPLATPAKRLTPVGSRSGANLLALQRLAGNHAVAVMLQREAGTARVAPPPAAAPAAPAAQQDLSVTSAIADGEQGQPTIFKLRREHLTAATVAQRATIIDWVLSKKLGRFAGGVLGGDSERLLLDLLATTPDSQGPKLIGSLESVKHDELLHRFVDGANNVILHQEMSRLRMQRWQQAKGLAPKEPPPVLPWSDGWLTSITFTTQRVPDHMVKVLYPANLWNQVHKNPTPFTSEFDALPKDIFGGGHAYHADQPVFVHDHDEGRTVALTAAQLLGIEAKGIRQFVKRAEMTAAVALTMGLAGPAAPAAPAIPAELMAPGEAAAAAAEAAAAAAKAAEVAAIAARTPWYLTGPAISAASNVAVNVSGQLMEYQANWKKWNFPSIGFDAAVAVIGGELASKLAKALPVKVTALQDLADPMFYKNFVHQQSIFYLYGGTVAALKSLYRKAPGEKAANAAIAEQAVSAVKSVSAQSFMHTARGQRAFRLRLDDPKWRIIDKLFSLFSNLLIQAIYDTTPKA